MVPFHSRYFFAGLYPGKHGIIGKQFYDPDIPRGTNQGRGIFFDYRDQVITLHANKYFFKRWHLLCFAPLTAKIMFYVDIVL